MIDVDRAKEIILNEISPLKKKERLNFFSCLNRISAQDVKAKENIPPFNNSAMDGFAVRANDLIGASRKSPKILEVIEDLPAGYVAKKSIKAGQAIRIMTGAPMPKGADAVVMVEETRSRNDTVEIYKEIKVGENVRYAGEDVKKGKVVIKKGSLLKSGHIGMLASLGASKVKVFKRPKVAILATGDELVNVDERLGPGKIRNSNAYSLYSQVVKTGAIPILLGIARDKKADLKTKIKKGLSADMLLISGGISVGKYDYVKDVLKGLGLEMKFWRVAMRPGKPLAFGVIKRTPVFGLPGNPVSSMVSFEVFVKPAIFKMLGRKTDGAKEVKAAIKEEIIKKKGLRYFLRAKTAWQNEAYVTKTTGPQGSGQLKSMAIANSLIILPEKEERMEKGRMVTVRFLD